MRRYFGTVFLMCCATFSVAAIIFMFQILGYPCPSWLRLVIFLSTGACVSVASSRTAE